MPPVDFTHANDRLLVVARRLSRTPARARIEAPVQTEIMYLTYGSVRGWGEKEEEVGGGGFFLLTLGYTAFTNSTSRVTLARVPAPPGTMRTSMSLLQEFECWQSFLRTSSKVLVGWIDSPNAPLAPVDTKSMVLA